MWILRRKYQTHSCVDIELGDKILDFVGILARGK